MYLIDTSKQSILTNKFYHNDRNIDIERTIYPFPTWSCHLDMNILFLFILDAKNYSENTVFIFWGN